MASALQNRLVGTVIVVALAVIFLPDLLDGKKVSNEDVFVSVPATPAKKTIVNPEPFPSDRVATSAQRPIEIVDEKAVDADVEETRDQAQTASNSESSSSAASNDLATQTIVETPNNADDGAGWVVQLGSFSHQKNVRQLLEKLENAGYRAFSRPIQTSSGPLTKVFVGPDLDKRKLEGALSHLYELTGLKGKVTQFSTK